MMFEKSWENWDFEICLAGPQMFEIFKPIRIVTSQQEIKTR